MEKKKKIYRGILTPLTIMLRRVLILTMKGLTLSLLDLELIGGKQIKLSTLFVNGAFKNSRRQVTV
jgi:hypothetical protein